MYYVCTLYKDMDINIYIPIPIPITTRIIFSHRKSHETIPLSIFENIHRICNKKPAEYNDGVLCKFFIHLVISYNLLNMYFAKQHGICYHS